MSIINTNIASLTGQSNLRNSQSSLNTAMERLSSGLRINSAKDDAAGQAIANRMTAQINGFAQAQRNANDGISAAQTAEGALGQINDNVQRIRELFVQAQNETLSARDMISLQGEVDQRISEINRISENTIFNSTPVVGANSNMRIQVGANDEQVIDIDLKSINADTLGIEDIFVGGFSRTPAANALDVVDLLDQGGDASIGNVDYLWDNANNDYVRSEGADIEETARINGFIDFLTAAPGSFEVINDPSGSTWVGIEIDANGLINKDGPVFGIDSSGAFVTGGAVDVELNSLDELIGNPTASNNLTIVGRDAHNEDRQLTSNDTGDVFGTYLTHLTRDDVADAFSGNTVQFDGVNYEVSQGGSRVNINGAQQFIDENGDFTDVRVISEDVDMPGTALPLGKLDDALNMIDSQRSELGAVQNRMESAIENLATTETNLSAARSRIEDADYASEVADMTKNQILQQAGTSVLAQANQLPQNVLSLLG